MYEKINITENTLRITSLFTNYLKEDYYIREISTILKISPRTSQLILEDLESKGILKSKIKGKIRVFKLQKNKDMRRFIELIEQYKTITFASKNKLIKEIINEIEEHIEGIGIIFGSYVKELETEDSDLDIFVAGSYNEKEINKISKTYGIDISVKCYPKKVFKEKLKKDILLKEILKNHIIITNVEGFVKEVMKDE